MLVGISDIKGTLEGKFRCWTLRDVGISAAIMNVEGYWNVSWDIRNVEGYWKFQFGMLAGSWRGGRGGIALPSISRCLNAVGNAITLWWVGWI